MKKKSACSLHPMNGHYKRRLVLVVHIGPVDHCPVRESFGHVRQTAGERRPVQLQARRQLLRLAENHQIFTGTLFVRLGDLQLWAFWRTTITKRVWGTMNNSSARVLLSETQLTRVVERAGGSARTQRLSASVSEVLHVTVCASHCQTEIHLQWAKQQHHSKTMGKAQTGTSNGNVPYGKRMMGCWAMETWCNVFLTEESAGRWVNFRTLIQFKIKFDLNLKEN